MGNIYVLGEYVFVITKLFKTPNIKVAFKVINEIGNIFNKLPTTN
jgi:hypothetical protein